MLGDLLPYANGDRLVVWAFFALVLVAIIATSLREMDDINPEMAQIDVCLVVGANDVVNPVARADPSSPIAGMPIIDADKAKTVFAVKRSRNPGFAGIDNELYFLDKTWMLFGDAKAVLGEVVKHFSESSNGH